MVDYVVINHQSDSTELINLIKPNYYVKGPDYKKEGDLAEIYPKKKEQ